MLISTEIHEEYGFIKWEEYDDHILIKNLLIDNEYRRKGLGTYLYNEFIRRTPYASYVTKNIYLDVFEYNKGGIAFWESLGFKSTGEICDQGYLQYVNLAFEES